MALNGITLHALTNELNSELSGQRISKITQPENEELIFTFKKNGKNLRLLISTNASLPFLYLTQSNKESPLTAPNFCMVLRKYIGAGRIAEVRQMGYERVIRFKIEHLDELGDEAVKFLYVEIMGKHSNIIFTDEENRILDSIKHVGANMSSVREVLPGRDYFIPSQENKTDPTVYSSYTVSAEQAFYKDVLSVPASVSKALCSKLIGFSNVTANEICYNAGLDADAPAASLTDDDKKRLYEAFYNLMKMSDEKADPHVYFNDNGKPEEFSAFKLNFLSDLKNRTFDSVSELLEFYYAARNQYNNTRERTANLRKQITTLVERESKKLDLQQKQLRDTDKMDKYRVYGELLNTYGYSARPGDKSITVNNYYTGEDITIPLNPMKNGTENAKHYFDKYTKLKRTKEALTSLTAETEKTVNHLLSIEAALKFADNDEDLEAIKQEMTDYGYLKKHYTGKKKPKSRKSRPLHYITDDGFHIYVGKNNYQNDELTFKMADGNDWWFHAKKIPGSHVIVKTEGKELPDKDFEICAEVAGYYSSGSENDKLEIDYLQKKNVKKPNGAAPGFVIYYTNYSMVIHPTLEHVTPV